MKRNETLLFFDDYFKSIGLDYMIFASTLLGIIREGKMLPNDLEIDICVIGDDLTDEMIQTLKGSEKYFRSSSCKEKIGETYFHGLGNEWIGMNPIWLKKDIAYINMINSECITMDKKYHDKENWGTLEYLNRKFNCPQNPEKWLEEWYGTDWKTPKKCSWGDNTNRIQWEKI